MSKHSARPANPEQLRTSAEARIKTGTAPATNGWPAGEQALALLHTLASEPGSASDALKLLHELQVHQIELDLQQEQADQDWLQNAQAQAGYNALFELAPFGDLTVKPDGQLVESNRMANAWLGLMHEPDAQSHIDEFLAPQSRHLARAALERLRGGSSGETFIVRANPGQMNQPEGHRLQVRAAMAPGGQLVMMAFMPIDAALAL
jgi:PAS domain-containing protein